MDALTISLPGIVHQPNTSRTQCSAPRWTVHPRRFNVQLSQSLVVIALLASATLGQVKPSVFTGSSPAQAAPGDMIFADSFEAGTLTAWSSNSTNGGDLSVNTTAALRGGMGLQAVVNDNKSLFVTDEAPNAEPRYRARFHFDPASIKMADGNAFVLFNGYQGKSTAVLQIEFRAFSGGYQCRGRVLNNGSQWTNTAWLPISDAAHSLELDWRAASAAGAQDGGLTLWVDGTQQADLASIANSNWRIDRVRLGMVAALDSGTRGTIYLDAFESHRQSYIGPAGDPAPGATATPETVPTSTPLPTATSTALPTQAPENVKIVFSPSNEDFANPERGFMKQASVFPDQTLSLNKINVLQASDSLVWIYFRLDNYRDRPLDQNGLNTIRTVFSTARARGLKLVIRFVYNPGPGSTSDPAQAQPDAPIDLVLQHISQLKPILTENSDVIATLQVGFVGHWGEWHSTRYLHPLEYRRAIVDSLLDALPADRMLQLRYPRYKQMFFQGPISSAQAFNGSDQSRIGHQNDCFLEGVNDSGTYLSNTPQLPKQSSNFCDGQDPVSCWKAFVAQEGRFTPVGGETCAVNPPRTSCTNALQEMALLHWSFMNNGYKAEVLNGWTAEGCMDTIRRSLGYRLVLKEATFPASVRAGGFLQVNLRLVNQGFAAMYNPRPVYLVLLNGSTRYELAVDGLDPRRWEPGQEQDLDLTVNLPASIPPGSYRLALWLPDAAPSLRNTPAYSVRFANTNVWEAATGMNILTSSLGVLP